MVPFTSELGIGPLQYGYELDNDDDDEYDDGIIPRTVDKVLAENFPLPCRCVKCAGKSFVSVECRSCYIFTFLQNP